MNDDLTGLRIAMLVADGFEQVELTGPRQALLDAGAKVDIVSPNDGNVLGYNHHEKGDTFPVDVPLEAAMANKYDALVLPGGVANPDELRIIPEAVAFVKSFFQEGKPVAAICHGPWTLVEADVIKGLTLTSWPSLKTDIKNAGAVWIDQETVQDRNLLTSRKPDDIPAFNAKMIVLFAERTPATARA